MKFSNSILIYRKTCYKTIIPSQVNSRTDREINEDENYMIIKEREVIIFDDGSTKEGDWKIVEKKQKLKPKKLNKTTKEKKTVLRQRFINSTYILTEKRFFRSDKIHEIPTTKVEDYTVTLERDRLEYDNVDVQYTEWSECS